MLLLWLGAAISISEIFTGGLIAPLGLGTGIFAILTGHVIGIVLLALGGHISFSRGENAMTCVSARFGAGGGAPVALCNVIQLIGWTVVMIVQGASAVTSVFTKLPFAPVALVLAILVCAWALMFGSPAGRLNDVIVVVLAALCVLLFAELFGGLQFVLPFAPPLAPSGALSVAAAVELSAAMPVSWLPLIGDYTVRAEDRTCAVAMPVAGYFAGSTLMYVFGLFIGIRTGGDIFTFIAQSAFRYEACAVVLLSTLTTAFLDLYSAAESSRRIVRTHSPRVPLLVIGAVVTLAAVCFPVERYESFLTGFLTAISMVFVPTYTVLFMDFWVEKHLRLLPPPWVKISVAAVGVAAYGLFGAYAIGIPTLLCVALMCALYPACAFALGRTAQRE